jgi:hypothetical protein
MLSHQAIIKENETEFQKQLLDATIEVAEEERKKIASNIHDDVGLTLNVLKLNFSKIKRNIDDKKLLNELIDSNIKIIEETSSVLRGISHELMPPTLSILGLEKGLIRYDSENGIKNKVKLAFTTRMKAYSVVLLVLISVEVVLLSTRSDYDATILRAKGMLYQQQPNEQLSNLYTIKLVNKTRKELPVELKVENFNSYKLQLIGKDIVVKEEGVTEGEFFVYLNKSDVTDRKIKLEIGVYSNGKKIKTVKTNFLGPIKFKQN